MSCNCTGAKQAEVARLERENRSEKREREKFGLSGPCGNAGSADRRRNAATGSRWSMRLNWGTRCRGW